MQLNQRLIKLQLNFVRYKTAFKGLYRNTFHEPSENCFGILTPLFEIRTMIIAGTPTATFQIENNF